MAVRERAAPHALDLPNDTPRVFYAGQPVVAVDGFTSTATASERCKLSGFIRTKRQPICRCASCVCWPRSPTPS
jgi:hypothetical protein